MGLGSLNKILCHTQKSRTHTHTHTVTERDRAILRRVGTVITVGVRGGFAVKARQRQRRWWVLLRQREGGFY